MPSPLDYIISAGEPLMGLAQTYESRQPVSGARASLLDYYQKVINGEMDADTARVLYQAQQTGYQPASPAEQVRVPTVPTPTPAPSATPGAARNAALGLGMRSADTAPVAATPRPAPVQPATPQGLGTVLAPTAPPQAVAAPPAPASMQLPGPTAGLAAPAQAVSAYVPPEAPQAQGILGIGTPMMQFKPAEVDVGGYARARQNVQQAMKKQPRPRINLGTVTNAEYADMRSALENMAKASNDTKYFSEAAKLQTKIDLQEQRELARTNVANMNAEQKAQLNILSMQQKGQLEAAKVFQDYVQLKQMLSSREWLAKFNSNEDYRRALIALHGSLSNAEARVLAAGTTLVPGTEASLDDIRNVRNMLEPFIRQAAQVAPVQPAAGSSGEVRGSVTPAPAPARVAAPAPVPAKKQSPAQKAKKKSDAQSLADDLENL